jgi:hypothetical protein
MKSDRLLYFSTLILLGFLAAPACAENATADTAIARSFTILAPDVEVDLALSAAPQQMRAEASVYLFGQSGYVKSKQGNSGVTCLVNRDGFQYGELTLRPTCWDIEGSATLLPIALKVGELIALGKTAEEIKQVIDEGFKQGHFISPRKTGIAYMLRGDIHIDPVSKVIDKVSFPPHYMVYAPGVSNADIGIDFKPNKEPFALPFIYAGYSGGVRTAYLIILASEGKAHEH